MKPQSRGRKTQLIIEHLKRNPKAKPKDIAKAVGCSVKTVSGVKRQYFPETLDSRYASQRGVKDKVLKLMLSQPHLINARIAELCQCTPAYVSLIRARLGHSVTPHPVVELDCPPNLFLYLYDQAEKSGDDIGPEDIARGILTDAMLDAQEAAE